MAIEARVLGDALGPTFPKLMQRRCDGAVLLFVTEHSAVVLWHDESKYIGQEVRRASTMDYDVYTGTLTLRNA